MNRLRLLRRRSLARLVHRTALQPTASLGVGVRSCLLGSRIAAAVPACMPYLSMHASTEEEAWRIDLNGARA